MTATARPPAIDARGLTRRFGTRVAVEDVTFAVATGEIVALFRGVVDGTLAAADANAQLQPLMPAQGCNGYWHSKPGLETWKTDAQGALQQVPETA